MLIHGILKAADLGLRCLEVADQVVQKLPVLVAVRAIALDTLLGPEDEWDHVSTTDPPTLLM